MEIKEVLQEIFKTNEVKNVDPIRSNNVDVNDDRWLVGRDARLVMTNVNYTKYNNFMLNRRESQRTWFYSSYLLYYFASKGIWIAVESNTFYKFLLANAERKVSNVRGAHDVLRISYSDFAKLYCGEWVCLNERTKNITRFNTNLEQIEIDDCPGEFINNEDNSKNIISKDEYISDKGFSERVRIGSIGERLCESYYLSRDFQVRDVTKDKTYQEIDTDFIISKDNYDRLNLLEVKTQTVNSDNLFFQSLRNFEENKAGYLIRSKAEILFYYDRPGREIYIFNFMKLKYILKHGDFNKVKPPRGKYHSEGYLIPKSVILKNAENFGLLRYISLKEFFEKEE